MKDKDDRKPHDSSRGGWGAPSNNNGGWGNNQTAPNSVPDSRLQQANRQVSHNNQNPRFDDDIPF